MHVQARRFTYVVSLFVRRWKEASRFLESIPSIRGACKE